MHTATGLLVSLLVLGLVWAPARAQQDEVEDRITEAKALDEVVVTAQRREQKLQEIPIAVSNLSGAQLERLAVDETLDFIRLIPNLVGSNNTGLSTANVYYLRGLGNTESIATFDPPIGTYVDEVYMSRQNANNFALFDVERVEILRGPQGTLFGRNTTGGAINVILRKPEPAFGGYGEAGVGRFGGRLLRASIDLPFADNLLSKLSLYGQDDDGYVRNLSTGERLNDTEARGARLALSIFPADHWTIELSADAIDSDGANLLHVVEGGRRVARTGLREGATRRTVPGSNQPVLVGAKNDFGLGNQTHSRSLIAHVIRDFDPLSLTWIAGYRRLEQDFLLDFFDAPFPFGGFTIGNAGVHRQLTHELKLDGSLRDGELEFVAGLFWMREDNRTDFGDVFSLGLPGIVPAGFPLVLADRIMDNDTRSLAYYAQIDWRLDPQWMLTLGARYTDDRKTVDFTDLRPVSPSLPAAARLTTENMLANGIPVVQEDGLVTPRVSLTWTPQAGRMLYASATRGFKSGGWNARGTAPQLLAPFGPERVWSYELGGKFTVLDGAGIFNATAFYTDVSDFQIPSAEPTPAGFAFITRNFSDLRNHGLELEFAWRPDADLELFATAGFQNPRYTNFAPQILAQQAACRQQIASQPPTNRPACGGGLVTPDGRLARPVRSPKRTLIGGLTYRFAFADGWTLEPTLSLNYTSDWIADTTEQSLAEPGLTVYAALVLHDPDRNWQIALDCDNCSDRRYFVSRIPPAPPYLNAPGQWSLRVLRRF